jgi:hypothetical protein
MWKLVFNAIDVIFKFESLKRKNPCYVQKNNAPSKIFNFFFFWNKKIKKQTKIATHMDLWKCGQILTVQKSLTIKRLRFQTKKISYEFFILYYIIYWVLITNLECESI